MKLNGKQFIDRPPEEVWRLIVDPEVLKRCIPGCELLENLDENRFRVKIQVGIGPFEGKFSGIIELADVVEQDSYRLIIRAKGPIGSVNGIASLNLVSVDDGYGTEIIYESEAHMGGALASIGSRLFESEGRKFAGQFFDRLAKIDPIRPFSDARQWHPIR